MTYVVICVLYMYGLGMVLHKDQRALSTKRHDMLDLRMPYAYNMSREWRWVTSTNVTI